MQTIVHARAFLRFARLPAKEEFTLIDCGCALGEALQLIAEKYPRARLTGIDLSSMAITRCQSEHPGLAHFEVRRIENLEKTYDVAYASNILEHFVDFKTVARGLMRHCRRAYIIVPFMETHNGQPLSPNPTNHHQHSFDRQSFDFLVSEGLAATVESRVIACPHVWSWSLRTLIIQNIFKNPIRLILGKPIARNPMKVLFNVSREAGRRTL